MNKFLCLVFASVLLSGCSGEVKKDVQEKPDINADCSFPVTTSPYLRKVSLIRKVQEKYGFSNAMMIDVPNYCSQFLAKDRYGDIFLITLDCNSPSLDKYEVVPIFTKIENGDKLKIDSAICAPSETKKPLEKEDK